MAKAGVLTVDLKATVDVNRLLDQIGSAIGKLFDKGNYQRQEIAGGVWISTINNGTVLSAFFHPSRSHSATANGGAFGGGEVKSISGAGKWAVAWSSKGLTGAKTNYGFA